MNALGLLQGSSSPDIVAYANVSMSISREANSTSFGDAIPRFFGTPYPKTKWSIGTTDWTSGHAVCLDSSLSYTFGYVVGEWSMYWDNAGYTPYLNIHDSFYIPFYENCPPIHVSSGASQDATNVIGYNVGSIMAFSIEPRRDDAENSFMFLSNQISMFPTNSAKLSHKLTYNCSAVVMLFE